MSGHTPGPWIIRDGDEWTHDVVTHHGELPDGSPNAWNVASINGRRDEARANLNLVGAAPDLLEACEAYMSMLRGQIRDGRPASATAHYQIQLMMEQAIARAKGEYK